ncbi:MAG: 2-dehydropantoate 2-reductase [Chloroflexi bacterium]|nr:2-dehydropantoate 2-reductase [Chloroflexota bacterium]
MRIAVYGAGGIGGFMGAQLCRAGHDVALIARGEHLRAIQEHGLQVEWPDGNYTVTPRIATNEPSEVGVVDLVILGVKAWQVPEAARALLPMVGPETRVLTVQNGVEAPYQVAEVVPAERVIAGVMYTGGAVARPGVIRRGRGTGAADSYIGQLVPEKAGCTAAVASLQHTLREVRFRIVVPEDIRIPLWDKFCVYPGTLVGSLCRAPLGVWRSVPESRALCKCAVEEAVAVAQARGVALGENVVMDNERNVDAYPAAHFSSTARDIVNGRPSELDAIVGAVVRMGRAAGVPTPVNEFLYAALLPQELKARGQIQWPE